VISGRGTVFLHEGLVSSPADSDVGPRRAPETRWHLAWLLLTVALAGHVLDEALTDFLSVYNPAAESIRQSLPWLPLPSFTFGAWIGGLVVAVLGLAALAPFARNGTPWMRGLSRVYGVLMSLNALGHLGGSLLLGRWLPGVVSAPFLLAAALFLLWSVPRPAPARGSRHP
jgi:hypothetical protein